MKSTCRLSFLFASTITIFGLAQTSHGQSTFYWRAEATTGTWQLADNWWNGSQTAVPVGSDILRFENDFQVTMDNDLAATTRHQIYFDSGSTVTRTISGSVENEFVSVASNAPLIRNDSAASHVLNFPILINSDNLIIHTASAGLSLGGTITGSAGIIKEGSETLTLTGANTFTGKTSVNGGTLFVDAITRLGTVPATYVADQLTLNNGTLKTAVGLNISANRGITLGASGAILDNSTASNSTNFTLSSQITGSGSLTLNANGNTSDSGGGAGGNLTLGNSSNDFIGNVTINSGVVNFASDAAFGNAANTITIANGGFVCTASANSLAATRSIILAGGGDKIFRAYGSSTFTVDGPISGMGNIRHTDGGILNLNGANTFTGNIFNARGKLTLANSAHVGNVTGQYDIIALKSGNTYTGITFLTSGATLRLDADNALPDSTTILLYNGTTFNANGKTDTLGSLTTGSFGDSGVILNLGNGANLTVTNNNLPPGLTANYSNATVSGKITGNGNFTYHHASSYNGQWDFSNDTNDFIGTITVTQGRLRVAADSCLGNADNDLVFNGDVVSTLGNNEGKSSLQVAYDSDLNLGANRTITLNSGKEGTMYVWGGTTMTINGKITGGGNLRKEDGGTLILNNATNDWAGETKVASGQLQVGTAGSLPSTTTAIITGGAINLNGINTSVVGLSGGGQTGGLLGGNATLTVTGSGTYDYSGRVLNYNGPATVKYTGSGSLTLSGDQDNSDGRAIVESGTLILGKSTTGSIHALGTNNSPALTINGGTCQLGGTGGDQIYQASNVHMTGGIFDLNGRNEGFRGLTGTAGTITNNGSNYCVLTLGQQSVAGNVYSFAGSINDGTNEIDLTKTGSGTLELAGNSNYSGYTTVNSGTLRVQGSLGATPTSVTGTLAGNGSINDVVTLQDAGGIGTSITDWNGSAGTGFDDLSVSELVINVGAHTVTIDTSALVNFTETTKTFPILKTTNGISGFNALEFTISAPGFSGTGTWTIQQTSNNLELVYTAGTDPYNSWAAAMGLTSGNNGKSQDADNDGRTNLQEFAFNGNPLSAANDGKMVAGLADPDGAGSETSALILTLPVRDGAVFTGPGDLISAAVDGVIYQIQGSDDLVDFTTMDITEVTPALSTGLPTLDSGWSYRSFRTPGSPAEPDPRDFIRAGVEQAP